MIKFFKNYGAFIASTILVFAVVKAGVPQMVSYQGNLTDNLGNPISGLQSITFSIYPDEVGGTALWSETQSVSVANGSFSVLLGSINEIHEDVFDDSTCYLGIMVGSSSELPRSLLTTSPYAYRVATVDGSVSTALLLIGPDGTRVELGAGQEILNVFDTDGDLRIRLSLDPVEVLTDGGGAISFLKKPNLNKVSPDGTHDIGSNLVKLGESQYGTGEINTFDSDGNELTRITSTSAFGGAFNTYLPTATSYEDVLTVQGQATDSGGYIGTWGANGNEKVTLTSLSANSNGYLGVADTSGLYKVSIYADLGNDGHITTRNQYGQQMVNISNTGYSLTENGGWAQFSGANGTANVVISHLPGLGNQGIVEVYDSLGIAQAGMKVDSAGNGVIWGDVKSFAMANPVQPGTEIWYSSLEGPEAAAYFRGTANLINGMAVINFPEHFVSVASPNGLTAVVTPSSAESKGLAVVEKHIDYIVVRELYNGSGNYDFDYTITAVRKGFEDYEVVHPVSDRRISPKDERNMSDEPAKFIGLKDKARN